MIGSNFLTLAHPHKKLILVMMMMISRKYKLQRGSRLCSMSYLLPHLTSGWAVDQAILTEEERVRSNTHTFIRHYLLRLQVVVVRFGHDWDPTCMEMDECLSRIAEDVKNFAVVYLVRP